jgi:hypothetical protein
MACWVCAILISGADTARAEWWAIMPLTKPPVPDGAADHPIDAFIEPALAARPIECALPADRRTLIRRLTVDLHGLLPTPEEVCDFEMNTAPDAVQRLVDRLLASPRYGERWARHWLDVAHFAETHGHDQDRPRETAWPYRDYVIASFNADKPYASFVKEQIAADALFPDRPELTPALGFLAAGPWDESSLRDIREDTLDREIGRYLDRDDIVANVMSTFTAATVHCARCHDHKFDPISQRDYYALQAVFAGTEKAERLYDLDLETHRRRQTLMRLQVAVDRRDEALIEQLRTPALRSAQIEWEDRMSVAASAWQPVRPESFEAQHGAILTLQDDHSLLAHGDSPPQETYVIRAAPGTMPLTAVRLELLPDESLPARGPGRASNGNLHLTDFSVFLNRTGEPGPVVEIVPLRNPSADFNQEGWDVAMAIDEKPDSGWGIHPHEGKAHEAVFEFATPVVVPPGGQLVFRLRQDHGRQHTIGRLRLSVTSVTPPPDATVLPAAAAAALAVRSNARSSEEQFTVLAHFLNEHAARELARLPEPERVYAGAGIFPPNANQKPVTRPRPVKVLRRGEITLPIEDATPGALTCVSNLSARFPCHPDESARRADLARWLTDRDNPLLWRVIVNRVWHYHFGRGLVATPNDFGRMGAVPSSPELLDWLAVTFRDDMGGSLKALHRLILTSRAWQQQAVPPDQPHSWRPLVRRLDAETLRDSVLHAVGLLDHTAGGPSIRQFLMSAGIHVTPNVDYSGFDVDAPGAYRRSVYRFLFRTLPDPLMDALDCPAGDQSAPVRTESFTALQAFALLNHPFMVRHAEHLAARLQASGDDPAERVRLAYQLLFQREPLPDELSEGEQHANEHGLANLCRLLLNSNEFHFLN